MRKINNRAGQAFRMVAFTLWNNKGPLGDQLRKLKALKNQGKAIVVIAHKLARIFYKMVTKQIKLMLILSMKEIRKMSSEKSNP